MSSCTHNILLPSHNYFSLCNYNVVHNITTDGSCSKFCGSLSTYNARDNVFVISSDIAKDISICLETCDVVLEYEANINIAGDIVWSTNHGLFIKSDHNISLTYGTNILNKGQGTLKLMAGVNGNDPLATVIFEEGAKILASGGGTVEIYYNPIKEEKSHKYHNPYDYSNHVEPEQALLSYMLVNNVQDLKDIVYFLSGNYALSNHIVFPPTYPTTRNFEPLFYEERQMSFAGNFDGNGYSISSLNIISDKNNTGLFSNTLGTETKHNQIKNIEIKDSHIEGNWRIGSLIGNAVYTDMENIKVNNVSLKGHSVIGSICGTMAYSTLRNFSKSEVTIDNVTSQCIGEVAGAVKDSLIADCEDLATLAGCVYDN